MERNASLNPLNRSELIQYAFSTPGVKGIITPLLYHLGNKIHLYNFCWAADRLEKRAMESLKQKNLTIIQTNIAQTVDNKIAEKVTNDLLGIMKENEPLKEYEVAVAGRCALAEQIPDKIQKKIKEIAVFEEMVLNESDHLLNQYLPKMKSQSSDENPLLKKVQEFLERNQTYNKFAHASEEDQELYRFCAMLIAVGIDQTDKTEELLNFLKDEGNNLELIHLDREGFEQRFRFYLNKQLLEKWVPIVEQNLKLKPEEKEPRKQFISELIIRFKDELEKNQKPTLSLFSDTLAVLKLQFFDPTVVLEATQAHLDREPKISVLYEAIQLTNRRMPALSQLVPAGEEGKSNPKRFAFHVLNMAQNTILESPSKRKERKIPIAFTYFVHRLDYYQAQVLDNKSAQKETGNLVSAVDKITDLFDAIQKEKPSAKYTIEEVVEAYAELELAKQKINAITLIRKIEEFRKDKLRQAGVKLGNVYKNFLANPANVFAEILTAFVDGLTLENQSLNRELHKDIDILLTHLAPLLEVDLLKKVFADFLKELPDLGNIGDSQNTRAFGLLLNAFTLNGSMNLGVIFDILKKALLAFADNNPAIQFVEKKIPARILIGRERKPVEITPDQIKGLNTYRIYMLLEIKDNKILISETCEKPKTIWIQLTEEQLVKFKEIFKEADIIRLSPATTEFEPTNANPGILSVIDKLMTYFVGSLLATRLESKGTEATVAKVGVKAGGALARKALPFLGKFGNVAKGALSKLATSLMFKVMLSESPDLMDDFTPEQQMHLKKLINTFIRIGLGVFSQLTRIHSTDQYKGLIKAIGGLYDEKKEPVPAELIGVITRTIAITLDEFLQYPKVADEITAALAKLSQETG